MRADVAAAGPRWGRYAALAVAVGVIAVGVPPLIAPPDEPSAPVAASQPAATPGPSPSPSPSPGPASTPSLSPNPSASPSATPGPARCVAGGASPRPACAVYTTALGSGWAAEGVGVKVVPAGLVPGTEIVALRVEPKEKTASVSLIASEPFTVADGTVLKLRIYGGRLHGTVARLALSPTTEFATDRPATLNAPVDEWVPFTVPVADLLPGGGPIRRIDLEIATEAVPNAYRFFIDDVAFVAP
ncbi:hypothetical protein J2S43_004807 [Catenuloplanes nepalensis]|uniref:Uncharacterized protein n=1 Tax=Catenuloplanes nepalensis TaxID=587533 RepID=A0ABT9MXY3_9ACTN|nr:hypothetical protein [Catenuloplanes nepalensis]MDP9796295.1 hypothetical protein [Catenuloplanes nepalensis]